MADPEVITSETFAPHVGASFELVPQKGEPIAAVLESCEETSYGDRDEWVQSVGRMPFTLLFVAPGGELTEQQIFTVRNADLGELGIFLVPLGPTRDGGMRYEAVFS